MLPAYKLPQRTRIFCQVLKWLTIILTLSYGVFVFWSSYIDIIIDEYWQEIGEIAPSIRDAIQTSALKKGLLQALAIIQIIIPVSIAIAATNLFAKFQTGEVFTKKTLSAMRFLAVTILIYALSKIIMYSAFIGVLTYDNPKGQRLISFTLNSSQIITLLIGIIFMIIATIFSEAVRQSDENRQIV